MSTPEEATPSDWQQSSRKVFWKAAGVTAGLTGAIYIILLILGVATAAGLGDIFNQDQFNDRVDAINAVYRQGVEARETLNYSGTTITNEAMCEDAYHRMGADHERRFITRRTADGAPDVAFAQLRQLSFINGCLGRPNDLPATPLPSPPSPIPSR